MNLSIPLGSRWVGFFADLVVLDDLLGFGRSFNSLTSLYYQLFVILRIEWSNRRYHWTFLEQFEAVFDFRTIRFWKKWLTICIWLESYIIFWSTHRKSNQISLLPSYLINYNKSSYPGEPIDQPIIQYDNSIIWTCSQTIV